MMIAYGDCLQELGRSGEAEPHYRAAIKTGGPEHLIDLAKSRLTKKSEETLRASGDLRPDVVRYMIDAFKQFETMTEQQIQNLALEIAMLGNKGLDINDPRKTYRINSLPGEYTGLHLISIMYTAFQRFAPGTDVGIDLSREYLVATSN